MNKNPVLWLAHRCRWEGLFLRCVMFLLIGAFGWFLVVSAKHSVLLQVGHIFYYLLILLFYLWVASQASRFFVEAWRTGALELLLSSPLSAQTMIQGQWLALKRIFLLPLIILVVLYGIITVLQWKEFGRITAGGATPGFNFELYQILTMVSGIVISVSNLLALGWFGMWMGLTSKKANTAIMKTIAFVLVIPWLCSWFVQVFLMVGITWSNTPFWVTSVIMCGLLVGKNVVFILYAKKKLNSDIRSILSRAIQPFHSPPVAAETNSPPIIAQ